MTKNDSGKNEMKKDDTHPLTRQESENIDLAEKGIESPLNPQKKGMPVDSEDRKSVLKDANLKDSSQKSSKPTHK